MMKEYDEIAKAVREQVGKGNIKLAIQLIVEENIPDLEKQIRAIESRFNRIKKAELAGTVNNNEATIEINKITDSLLSLTEEIKHLPEKQVSVEQKKTKIKLVSTIMILGLLASLGIIWGNKYFEEKAAREAQEEIKKEAEKCKSVWEACLKSKEVKLYELFLSGDCRVDSLERIAKDSIAAINKRNAWSESKNINTFKSYLGFISQYAEHEFTLIDKKNLKPIVESEFEAFYRFDNNTKDAVGEKNGKRFSYEHDDSYIVDRFNKENNAYAFLRPNKTNAKNLEIIEYIEFPTPIIDPSVEIYSISFWVKFNQSSDGGTLFGQYQSHKEYFWDKWARYNNRIELRPSSILIDNFYPKERALKERISPGLKLKEWHHVVIARNPTKVYFYLDSHLMGEWNYDESYNLWNDESGSDIKLARIGGWGPPFKGSIDDMGFSNKTLSADEVKLIYAAQKVD